MSAELAEWLCALRVKLGDWGARKLLRVLTRRHPRRTDWPAPSRVSALLAREGLVTHRRRRRTRPGRILAPAYPGHFTVKGVTTGGTFRFHNRLLYLANALSGERVGLDEVDDGVWHIYFGAVLIVTLDEREYFIRE